MVNVNICSIDDDLKKKIKTFKMRKEKNNAAIISKCTVIQQDSVFANSTLTFFL